jgi:hypothetical protein
MTADHKDELGTMRAEARADAIKRRGQLPTWWRTRDEMAVLVSKWSGSRKSDRTLRRLAFAIEAGCPALREALNADRLSIAAGAELARLPVELQTKCLDDPARRRSMLRALRLREKDDGGAP